MFGYLLILFIGIPLLELALLLHLADVIGGWTTFTIVILTGMLGSYLVRQQGVETIRLINQDLAEGRMPADRIFSGLLILIGGAFLITPGVLTDLVGFCLMVPGNRRLLLGVLKEKAASRMEQGQGSFFHFQSFGPRKGPSPFDRDEDDGPFIQN